MTEEDIDEAVIEYANNYSIDFSRRSDMAAFRAGVEWAITQIDESIIKESEKNARDLTKQLIINKSVQFIFSHFGNDKIEEYKKYIEEN